MDDRFQHIVNKASTAIIVVNRDLVVDYVNPAAKKIMENYQREIRGVYPDFDLEKLIGLNLASIHAISQEFLSGLKDPHRKIYADFMEVGKETVHVTIHPIISADGADLGSAVEWWHATDYLKAQAHEKKVVEASSLIDELTFQANILSINAAVEAAHAGEYGRSFAVIANEMRDLSLRCRVAAKELKSN